MLFALDDQTKSWASQANIMEKHTRSSFHVMIRTRFTNQNHNNATLTEFIARKHADSYDEFIRILKDATLPFERDLLQLKPLTHPPIIKFPLYIKTLPYEKGKNILNWHKVVRKTEEAA